MPQYRPQDHYFKQAKVEGYASRAAFKLKEIQEKYHIIRPGDRVLDLGCAPGGWLQPLAQFVGKQGRIVGVDPEPVRIELPKIITCLVADIAQVVENSALVLEPLGDLANVVLSDMAPATSGTSFLDKLRACALAELAWECAQQTLAPGGHFVVKIFDGPDIPALRKQLTAAFQKVTTMTPKASRRGSVERYFVCQEKLRS